jgi:hypothetical protein
LRGGRKTEKRRTGRRKPTVNCMTTGRNKPENLNNQQEGVIQEKQRIDG